MILKICDSPEILSAMKYVKLVINLVKVLVPIILILSISIALVRTVSGKADEELPKVLKSSVNKILAAVLVFLVPTLVNTIIATMDAESIDFASCLNNATEENINIAYLNQANKYLARANETLLRGDYNIAVSKINTYLARVDEPLIGSGDSGNSGQSDDSGGSGGSGPNDQRRESRDQGAFRIERERFTSQLGGIEKKIKEREDEEKKEKEKTAIIGSGFMYPLGEHRAWLTACYGGNDSVHRSLGSSHPAIDIATDYNTPIYASKGGKVIACVKSVMFNSTDLSQCGISTGNYVIIDHLDGTKTKYVHLYPNSVLVNVGDMVSQGQKIGGMGSTGCSTGSHLHFEIHINGTKVNPIKYIDLSKINNPTYCG